MSATNIIQEGGKIMVEELGLPEAPQFVLLLERGQGDSVKEVRDYWGDAGIDEIHQRVSAWKSNSHSD